MHLSPALTRQLHKANKQMLHELIANLHAVTECKYQGHFSVVTAYPIFKTQQNVLLIKKEMKVQRNAAVKLSERGEAEAEHVTLNV